MNGSKWTHIPGAPSDLLKSFGIALAGYAETAGRPVRRIEIPTGPVVLIVGLGDALHIRPAVENSAVARHAAFVVGLRGGSQLVEHQGNQDCIEIVLPPCTAISLFNGAAAEFGDTAVDLHDVWPNQAHLLIEQLREQGTWSERLNVVDRFLAAKLSDSARLPSCEIRWAWGQLELHRGLVPIRWLAKTLGWSDRHFTTRFRSELGIAPKSAAQRLRFGHAVELLRSSPHRPLSDMALRCGYSDQSHFTREIRRCCGRTPLELQRARFADLPGIPA